MSCDYPIFLDLTDRLAVVVGGGRVATRKVEKLLAAGARVRVVAPDICARIGELAQRSAPPSPRPSPCQGEGETGPPIHPAPAQGEDGPERARRVEGPGEGELEIVREPFEPGHLDGALLVFACTDEEAVNRAVASAARAAGVLVNRADDPADCDFFVPAVTERGPVKLAVSAAGSAALAGYVRQWLDANLPPELATLGAELARTRPIVRQRVARAEDRAAVWRTLCGERSIALLAEGDVAAWRAWFDRTLAKHAERDS